MDPASVVQVHSIGFVNKENREAIVGAITKVRQRKASSLLASGGQVTPLRARALVQ
jgi:hypothetical protein